MNYISLQFLVFFIIILVCLKWISKRKQQQWLLLAASYVFYAVWDYRFLILLFLMSTVMWLVGKKIEEYPLKSKGLCTIGVSFCVVILGIFKYYGFFMETFCSMFQLTSNIIKIILPLGISFYTFQSISYLCDLKNKRIQAYGFREVLLYIGFFPQIVSGPIVKARDFLPQLENKCVIEMSNISVGVQLFLLGLIKKVVIADRLGIYVDTVYLAPEAYSGISLLVATIAYAIQIYCDFSGYSDMAIGVAKCMGIDLGINFNMPYISQNISEFWRRWHISLSSWFRDYVYIPLGGNRKGEVRTCFNLLVTMLLSGLWHGASWNYVLWGGLHGILSIVDRKIRKVGSKYNWKRQTPYIKNIITALKIIINTSAVCILWVPFRAKSIKDTWIILKRIFGLKSGITYIFSYALIYGILIMGVQIWAVVKNNGNNPYRPMNLNNFCARIVFCIGIILAFLFAYIGNSAFIYAQF